MRIVSMFVVSIFLFFGLLFSATPSADAATRVNGYFRSSGTYVAPYYRSSPNSYKFDNYSSRGNYNPYTGRRGYKGW